MTRSESKRIEGKGQFVKFVEHVMYQGFRGPAHTLRVRVEIGGCASQSFGIVERHDGVKWHEVATISGPALKVDPKAGYGVVTESTFRPDRDALIKLAEEVL